MEIRSRRIIAALLFAALTGAAALALLGGCENTPAEPVFDNIFDPAGPGDGDPLNLFASLGDTAIILNWVQPQGYGISYYEISHSLNPFDTYQIVGTVEQSTSGAGLFLYPRPTPTATHYFKIQAFDADGRYTQISDQAPAVRSTPPRVTIGSGSGKTASRFITLNVLVSAGDSLRISNHRDFSDEVRVAVDEAGVVQAIPWLLPMAARNDTTLTVRVLAFPWTGAADTAAVGVKVDFTPDFTVAGSPATVASRAVTLNITPSTGLIFMRFAVPGESLEDQPWVHGADDHALTLADDANPQTVLGEFLGDFGFSYSASLTVTPDLLTGASFSLDLPENRVTLLPAVTVLPDAAATRMRFSESLDFGGAPWVDYAATAQVTLSPTAGRKIIYGQFGNDWAESAVLSDFVIYLEQLLAVEILAPGHGQEVPGGGSLQVLGTATAPAGAAAVDSVKFDAGGGAGFRAVTGTEQWSFLWEVPTVTAATPRILRARAWAAGDSVTTSITVTLVPGDAR